MAVEVNPILRAEGPRERLCGTVLSQLEVQRLPFLPTGPACYMFSNLSQVWRR